jgi:hypothetical protein
LRTIIESLTKHYDRNAQAITRDANAVLNSLVRAGMCSIIISRLR